MKTGRDLGQGGDERELETVYRGSAVYYILIFQSVPEILRTVCIFLIRETTPEGEVKRYGNNIHKIYKETTDINSGIFRESCVLMQFELYFPYTPPACPVYVGRQDDVENL